MPDFERVFDKLAVDIQPNEVEKQKMLAFLAGKDFARWQIAKLVGFVLVVFLIIQFCSGCQPERRDVDGKPLCEASSFFVYTEWNGHRYVVNNSFYAGGIAHDPDCPNCLKK